MSPLEAAAQTIEDSPETLIETVETISTNFHIHPIIVSVVVSVVVLIVAKILCAAIKKSLKKLAGKSSKFSLIMAQLVWKLCAAIIWIIAIVAVLGIFGIDLTPVLAGLGITGVVLGFALQESISSLFSGIMIAINTPFRVGDWVDIGDISGTVVSMDLMCVTLSSGDNKKITMNNKNVWGNTIVNYSYIERRRLDMTVSVRYTDDLEVAKETIRELLKSYPEILPEPVPLVEIGSYGASSVSLYVRPWVSPSDYWPVYWKFNADILKALQARGVEFDPDMIANGNDSIEGGITGTEQIMKLPGITAIFAGNDQTAFGIYRWAYLNGVRIPDDLSVIGFDDVPQAATLIPPMTTVRFPVQEVVNHLVKLLIAKLRQETLPPGQITLDMPLVIRHSVADRKRISAGRRKKALPSGKKNKTIPSIIL